MTQPSSDMSWQPCCFEEEIDEWCIRNIVITREMPSFFEFRTAQLLRSMNDNDHDKMVNMGVMTDWVSFMTGTSHDTMVDLPWSSHICEESDYDEARSHAMIVETACQQAIDRVNKAHSTKDDSQAKEMVSYQQDIMKAMASIASTYFKVVYGDMADIENPQYTIGIDNKNVLHMQRRRWKFRPDATQQQLVHSRIGAWLFAVYASDQIRIRYW